MSVYLCVLRIEIDEEIPEMADKPEEMEAARAQKKRDRGARESRPITVETYSNAAAEPAPPLLPASARRAAPPAPALAVPAPRAADDPATVDATDTITVYFGNPMLEVTEGVLHLYKENEAHSAEAEAALTLALLDVPVSLGARDLLAFVAACERDVAHVRVLRDGAPERYLALLTFRCAAAARRFRDTCAGAPYTSLEPALCRVAAVRRVDWAPHAAPPPAATELPTCAVCLERMDESVAGVLAVQCAHSFHAACLLRWGDASCPVCRCACTPDAEAAAACRECGAEPAAALWLCLVCGHVGCGRYERGHAHAHFQQTSHTYALQLGSERVWDYAADTFVHRLVQNKADGKLVAAGCACKRGEGEAGAEGEAEAELSAVCSLSAQLEAQRSHYQGLLKEAERAAAAERARLEARNAALERKMQQMQARMAALSKQAEEERALAAALARAQAERAGTEAAQAARVTELQEQLRDVMLFVEARDQLERAVPAAELATASVETRAPPRARRRR